MPVGEALSCKQGFSGIARLDLDPGCASRSVVLPVRVLHKTIACALYTPFDIAAAVFCCSRKPVGGGMDELPLV